MTDARARYLEFLRRPYELGHAGPVPPNVASLKADILALNRRTRHADDYFQSKKHAKDKIKLGARVPFDYYFGTDLKELSRQASSLDEFVLKPNHLSRGIGVRALKREGHAFIDITGEVVTISELLEECECLLSVSRYDAPRAILLEQRLHSHPAFEVYGDGMADIRMIFHRDQFLFCLARIPSEASKGYGNISRGANWGCVLESGEYVVDDRFQKGNILSGDLPFFPELLEVGLRVRREHGVAFQAIDMTVDRDGHVVVVETEEMIQFEYYLTDKGVAWLRSALQADLDLPPMWARLLHLNAKVRRELTRRARGLPRVS